MTYLDSYRRRMKLRREAIKKRMKDIAWHKIINRTMDRYVRDEFKRRRLAINLSNLLRARGRHEPGNQERSVQGDRR